MKKGKEVKIERLYILERAINIATGQTVRILEDRSMFADKDEPLQYRVSWTSEGPQDPQYAERFVTNVNIATIVAKRINEHEYQVNRNYYTEDENIKTQEDAEEYCRTIVGNYNKYKCQEQPHIFAEWIIEFLEEKQ